MLYFKQILTILYNKRKCPRGNEMTGFTDTLKFISGSFNLLGVKICKFEATLNF